MPLTPEEVRARRFRIGLLGYRKRDVVSFLREVAWDYNAALEDGTALDRVTDEVRAVERLLACAQESTQVLRLVAEFELRREQACTAAPDDALAGYRLSGAAQVLSAAADALERALCVVRRRNEVVGARMHPASKPIELQNGFRAGVAGNGANHTALAPPPPPPGVSTSVHASG
jgi:DivIVA domain-containing protein